MKTYILFAVLFTAATVAGCGSYHHDMPQPKEATYMKKTSN